MHFEKKLVNNSVDILDDSMHGLQSSDDCTTTLNNVLVSFKMAIGEAACAGADLLNSKPWFASLFWMHDFMTERLSLHLLQCARGECPPGLLPAGTEDSPSADVATAGAIIPATDGLQEPKTGYYMQ